MKTIDTFKTLKPNMKIHDTWYGNGKVLKIKKNTAIIFLDEKNDSWSYDREHINEFIKKGLRK